MPVLSRVASLRIDDSATHAIFRQWVATAAVQDTAAGGTVDVTVVLSTGGGVPPSAAETLALNFYRDDGTLIRSVPLAPAATNQTVTFHFTDTGAAGGSARWGTVEIAIRATRSGIGAYDVETDGSPSTVPAGNDVHLDRGWVRGTTTAALAVSNVALGGAKAEPAEYDESLAVRLTTPQPCFVARMFTITMSGASPALSMASTASAAGPWDAVFANVVDDRFPSLVTSVAGVTVPNSALTDQPATVLTAITTDDIDVDPRLRRVGHFQVDDDVFARSKAQASNQMLNTQSGFIASRFVRARTGTGVNGLTGTHRIVSVKAPITTVQAAFLTATRDGEDGWTELLVWGPSKPGGHWNYSVDVTAPADMNEDSLVVGATAQFSLQASDPRLVRIAQGGPIDRARHFRPGMTFQAGVSAVMGGTVRRRRQADGDGAGGHLVFVAIGRLQDTGVNAGFAEFVEADGVTWTPLTNDTQTIPYHQCTETRPGSGVYRRVFPAAQTIAWDTHDPFVIGDITIDGTSYTIGDKEPALGPHGDHGAAIMLDELGDVSTAGSSDNDVLGFDATSAVWGPAQAASGADGAPGASAYETAVANGFVGTESEWLASLAGAPGSDGVDGASAYEIAVAHGFAGTEAEWLASLEGEPGASGTVLDGEVV